MTIHHHFIYKQHPERYPQQHEERTCWLFTIKAIIESYYPELNQKPLQYASSRLQRLIKFSTPRQLSKTLEKYKIHHITGKLHKKDTLSQIYFLKKHIEDWPVVLVIAHAYTKGNMFSVKRALFDRHYLSIWWYDDEKEVFYCYDSHTTLRENNLPVGNVKLHYEDLIIYRDLACLGLFKKRFIAIKGKKK